jgi:glutamate-1-semialdehyde 2,1-aminomutase
MHDDPSPAPDLPARARRVLPSGIAHDVRFRVPAGPYLVSGAGARKTGDDGRTYIDFVQGHGALLLGIAAPLLTRAIQDAVARGTHLGGNHPAEVRWAELICEQVPSVEMVRFTASGTEATLLALRLARTLTGREKVIKIAGHFNGWHDYVVAGLEVPLDRPSSPGIPAGAQESVEVHAAAAVPDRLAAGDVAAVILEPNGGTWGTGRFAPGELAAIVSACRRHGTLSVFDEVISGFRPAPGGMQEVLGLTPDLTTMGKIMAGGMPGGAVGGPAALMAPLELRDGDRDWNRWRHVHHPGTYNGNPVSAAAGIAMLEHLASGEPCAEANAKGDLLRGMLSERLGDAGLPMAVWGESSWFHVAPGLADAPEDVAAFKAIPAALTRGLDRELLARGVDAMVLGGFVGTAHTEADLEQAADAYLGAARALAATPAAERSA